MSKTLAIIGTAGRGEDKAKLTSFHYGRMFKAVTTIMDHVGLDPAYVKVVSGGAAWADHLAVTLALRGGCIPENLMLYLPNDLDAQRGYYGSTPNAEKSANTSNWYHKLFSEKVGIRSLDEILQVKDMGATLDPGNGNFFARNALVAKSVSSLDDHLLAFTFGDPESSQLDWSAHSFGPDITPGQAGLKDGGTAHTFGLAKCRKWHIRIGVSAPSSNFI